MAGLAATTAAVLGTAPSALARLSSHATEAAGLSAVWAPTLIDIGGLADRTPVSNPDARLGFPARNGGSPLELMHNFSQGGPSVLGSFKQPFPHRWCPKPRPDGFTQALPPSAPP